MPPSHPSSDKKPSRKGGKRKESTASETVDPKSRRKGKRGKAPSAPPSEQLSLEAETKDTSPPESVATEPEPKPAEPVLESAAETAPQPEPEQQSTEAVSAAPAQEPQAPAQLTAPELVEESAQETVSEPQKPTQGVAAVAEQEPQAPEQLTASELVAESAQEIVSEPQKPTQGVAAVAEQEPQAPEQLTASELVAESAQEIVSEPQKPTQGVAAVSVQEPQAPVMAELSAVGTETALQEQRVSVESAAESPAAIDSWEDAEDWSPSQRVASTPSPARASRFEPVSDRKPASIAEQPSTLRSIEMRPSAGPARALASGLEDLPFPVASLAARWHSAPTAAQKIQAIARALSTSLRLLAAAELGVLAATGSHKLRLEAAGFLLAQDYLDRPLTPEQWARLVFRLAHLVAPCPGHTVSQVAQGLADAGGLAADIEMALRTVQGLEEPQEDVARDRHDGLVELVRTFVAVCKPLRNVQLVSMQSRLICAGDDLAHYVVHVHRGGASAPERKVQWVEGRLAKGWCYLLDSPGAEILLAPIAFGATCPECQRADLFLSDRILLAPSRLLSRGWALECGHASALHLPVAPLLPLSSAVRVWAG